jgi:hypothetical protein
MSRRRRRGVLPSDVVAMAVQGAVIAHSPPIVCNNLSIELYLVSQNVDIL